MSSLYIKAIIFFRIIYSITLFIVIYSSMNSGMELHEIN